MRRKFTELERNLVERSYLLYENLGGRYNANLHAWRFPEGEVIRFGHCEHPGDERQYKSDEYQFIGFDEVTEFLDTQYLYLFSRLRSATGVPLRMRAGTNPGGPGHEWVFKRFGYWLNPDAPIQAEPGQVLYIAKDGNEDVVVPKGTPGSIGRCFVRALLTDNPSVAQNGEYSRGLEELDQVTRAQLKDGNWLIKPAAGMYFKREWVKVVDAAPPECARIRFWDRAATEGGGDWTVGVRMARDADKILYIEDVQRFQKSPGGVTSEIKRIAAADGKGVVAGLSEDPGQAGKFESASYAKELQGYTLKFLRETGNKITRFGPFSSQAERGRVRVVRGAWNERYFAELEGFPDDGFDDQVDATSGALATIGSVGLSASLFKQPTSNSSLGGGTYGY